MSRIVLIDSTNNFLRNYAVRPTLDKQGNRNGGVYGMLVSLRYFCRHLKPDKVILAWDGAGGSKKRRKILPEYKQGRKAVGPARINTNYAHEEENREENLKNQRIRVAEYLQHLPVTQISLDDTEADDVIGYLSQFYKDDETVIVSDDKDFLQLINKNTIVFRPTSKILWNTKTLLDEYSIYPHNFAVAKAVVGDSSDNIKGVRGIGFKNLLKWFPFISEEDEVTITDLVSYSSEQVKDKKGKKYQKIIEAKEILERNYKVVQLRDPIISNTNIDLVHRELEKHVGLNASAMRSKFLIDGIRTLNNPFFLTFREILFRGNDRNGSS